MTASLAPDLDYIINSVEVVRIKLRTQLPAGPGAVIAACVGDPNGVEWGVIGDLRIDTNPSAPGIWQKVFGNGTVFGWAALDSASFAAAIAILQSDVSSLEGHPYVTIGSPPPSDLPSARGLTSTSTVQVVDGGPGSSVSLVVPANAIGDAQLRQGAATSVVGNPTAATANVQDIVATVDNTFLQRQGGVLVWGPGGGGGGATLQSVITAQLAVPTTQATDTRIQIGSANSWQYEDAAGNDVVLIGGDNLPNAFVVSGGTAVGGAGQGVAIGAGTAGTAAQPGGALALASGSGNTTAPGGAVTITAGAGGATGLGGSIAITTGAGGSTSGVSGSVTISTGATTNGNTGAVTITTSNATGTNGTAGDISIIGGSSNGSGEGADIILTAGATTNGTFNAAGDIQGTAGAGGTQAAGGLVQFIGGLGGTVSGAGGGFTAVGGAAPTLGNGGRCFLFGGQAAGAAQTGGAVELQGGPPPDGFTGNAGPVIIQGGQADGTTSDGGDVFITGGTSGSGLTAGSIQIFGGGGTGASAGGDLLMGGGAAITSGVGGTASLTGGLGGVTLGSGGPLILAGGNARVNSPGGAVSMTGGTGSGQIGGAVTIQGGPGAGVGGGGAVAITGGAGQVASPGATVTITSGAGGSTSGDSGNVDFAIGAVVSGTTGMVRTLGARADAATLSPAALAAGTTQNYAPLGNPNTIAFRITPNAAGSSLGGLASGRDGRVVALINIGAADLTLTNEDAGSTATNRFLLPSGVSLVLAPGASAQLWYDVASQRWRSYATGSAGGGGSVTLQAAIAGQGATPTTQALDTRIQLGNGNSWQFEDVGGTDVVVIAGDNSASAFVVAGGVTVAGAGQAVAIGAGTAATATQAGGALALASGSGNTTGPGGAVSVTAGAGGASGAGGSVAITAGAAGATTGDGGNVDLSAGASTTGVPGMVRTLSARADVSTLSPPALAAGLTQNYAPTGNAAAIVFRVSPDASGSSLGGLASGRDGRVVYLINTSTTATLQLTNEDAGSTAANRFALPSATTFSVVPQATIALWYDTTSSRWRTTGTTSSQPSAGVTLQSAITGQGATPTTQALDTRIQLGNGNSWQFEDVGGVDVVVIAGDNSASAFIVSGGTTVAGAGQAVAIGAGTAGTATQAGGALALASGSGNTTGPGGSVSVTAGAGGASGPGGSIVITAGAGGATTGDGGNVDLVAGASPVTVPGMVRTIGARADMTTISPAALSSGTVANYAPTGHLSAVVFRLTPNAAGSTIGGLDGGRDGRIVYFTNLSATASISLTNENAGSVAANRFVLPGATTLVIPAQSSARLWYDVTSSRWRALAVATTAAPAITLQAAVTGQGATPVTQSTDIRIQITNTNSWQFESQGGTDIVFIGGGQQANSFVVTSGVTVAGAGQAVSIGAGNAGTAAQNGGATFIGAGSGNTTGTGGAVTLQGGTGGTTSGTGGAVNITAGSGAGSGSGGSVLITAGAAGATGVAGGSMTIQGGTATQGAGGGVFVVGRNGVGTNRAGGAVQITSGDATGSATGGTIVLLAGNGGATGVAGTIAITGGQGGTTSGAGGSVTITGGAGVGTNQNGATVRLIGGAATGSGAAGGSQITGGASPTGNGGNAGVQGGSSGGAGTGGHTDLLPGTSVSGLPGMTRLQGAVALAAPISPAVLAGGLTVDYAPTGGTTANVMRITPDPVTGSQLSGITGGAGRDGRSLWIFNIGTGLLTLTHDGGGSAAANRFFLPNNASVTIRENGAYQIVYDETSQRWRGVSP